MKRYRWLVLLVLIAGVAGGGYWFYQTRIASGGSSSKSGAYTQIVQVKQGSLSSTLSVVGELDAVQDETLTFSHMSGTAKLAKLNAKAGNSVKKEDVLASIDPASYQQALNQAKSKLLAAQKTLSDLKEPPTAVEIAEDDLAIAQANYDLEKANQDLADLQSPDLGSLQTTYLDAQDALTQTQLSLTLADHDSLAKDARDLSYSADWFQRRINELEALKHPNLEQTERIITRTEKLAEFKSELAQTETEKTLENQANQASIVKTKAALATALDNLTTAQAGGSTLDVAQAQLAIQTAQVALAKAKKARADLDAGPDATELATDQAAVDEAQLNVDDAQIDLDGTQLAASFDGTVLKADVNVGDDVNSSTEVVTVANLKDLEVVASVDETTIKRVAEGQTATITFDAFPNQTFSGKVLSVPLQGALQNDVMVYEAPLSLAGADQVALLVGMTANVKIQVAEAKNALLVPTMALQKGSDGLYTVQVVSGTGTAAQAESVPVEVGLSDGTYTQITKGLNEGDRVVVQMESTTSQSNNNNQPGGGGMMPMLGGGGGPPGR